MILKPYQLGVSSGNSNAWSCVIIRQFKTHHSATGYWYNRKRLSRNAMQNYFVHWHLLQLLQETPGLVYYISVSNPQLKNRDNDQLQLKLEQFLQWSSKSKQLKCYLQKWYSIKQMGFHISSKVFSKGLKSNLEFILCDYLEHLPSMFKLFNSNGTFIALKQIPMTRITEVRNKMTWTHGWLRERRDISLLN